MAPVASEEVQAGAIVVPGTLLFNPASKGATFKVSAVSGSGTYVSEDGSILASVVGRVCIDSDHDLDSAVGASAVYSVETASRRSKVVPVVGSTVTCRVTKVTPRFALCDIVFVGAESVPGSGFRGMIRKENVRSFEVDRVLMHESFRPGDVVRAKVASLGSARSYELSTADTLLGVIAAMGEANEPLVPVSFEEMRCPVTGVVEKRKVAKQEDLQTPQ